MEGTPFGRYLLIELLGRGGMGEVWRAHDTVTDRVVAIKTLPPQYSDDPAFQQRFRREAQAAARLSSPHVIPIHDYGEIDGRLFVSMRLIEGRDLQALLSNGPLPPERAVRIVGQVAKALHAAHKAGLVHRDVKPSNVLVDDDDFAYLIDFGIARATDDTRLTGTGNAIGTFHYMAPERLGGAADDARADIYALACVLYECLTGQPPFTGTNMASLVASHLHTPPPQPSNTRPEVPRQLDGVIAAGMAKDPDRRYATTIELADAANAAVTAPVPLVTAPVHTPPPFVARPAPPTPAPAPPAWTPPPATNLVAPQQHSSRGHGKLIALTAAAVLVVVGVATATVLLTGRNTQSANSSDTSTAIPTSTLNRATTTTTTTTTTPAGPPPVTDAQLAGFLLSPADINAAMDTTGIEVDPEWEQDQTQDNTEKMTQEECRRVYTAAEWTVYLDANYDSVRSQQLKQLGLSTHIVTQAVVSFRTAVEAEEFYAASAQNWPTCKQFTIVYPSETRVATPGPVSTVDGNILIVSYTENPGGICHRALTAVNNVVVDVSTCTGSGVDSPADSAVTIARQIAARIPAT